MIVSNAKAKMQMGHMGGQGSSTFLRCQIRALHDWNETEMRAHSALMVGMMFWRSTCIDVSAEGIL